MASLRSTGSRRHLPSWSLSLLVLLIAGTTTAGCGNSLVLRDRAIEVAEDAIYEGGGTGEDAEALGLSFEVVTQPTHGAVTMNPSTGAFTYEPNRDFTGFDSFEFTGSNILLAGNTATVAITVTPVNDPPVAHGQSLALDEDTSVGGRALTGDVDGDALTYVLIAPPAHGTVTLDPEDGAFSFQPEVDYSGPDSFRFAANDGRLTSDEATVAITVNPVNDGPVAQALVTAVDEDTILTGRVVASDVDGPVLIYSMVEQPAHGTVTLNPGTGGFVYEPAGNYSGPDSFQFSASDGFLTSTTATVGIEVYPVNDAPSLVPISNVTLYPPRWESTVLLQGSDPDGDHLLYTADLVDPSVATVTVDSRGVMTMAGTIGGYESLTSTVTATVSDGVLQATQRVSVTVIPPPPPPPNNPTSEPGDGLVDLAWTQSPGARSYAVYWSADPRALPDEFARVAGIGHPEWRHIALQSFTTYRYQVSALGDGGEGARSSEVTAEPGPVPDAVTWSVAVSGMQGDSVHWGPVANATGYRVYFDADRLRLLGRRPIAQYIDADSSPTTVSPTGAGSPTYYRVLGVNGPRIAEGDFVAASTVFTVIRNSVVPATPALWDVDGDGCLDMVGAYGDCTGTFHAPSLEEQGLAGLFAESRVNRDSRFADFNGDGLTDIFTNVYSRADDLGSKAILHINDGAGHFFEDAGIAAMQVTGFGETVVVADFDNDGALDIFVPNYWHRDDGGRNWLLMNDGSGHFTDRAALAGFARLDYPSTIPEGAQALDADLDGWIDLWVSSSLFINMRDGTFRNASPEWSLPSKFDEGGSLVDIDLDGDFDYALNSSWETILYRNVDGRLGPGEFIEAIPDHYGFGLVVCDVNSDGYPDLLIPRNDNSRNGEPILLLNVHGEFHRSSLGVTPDGYIDLMSCGDLDRNGSADVVARWAGYQALMNLSPSETSFRIRLLGASGERNQQGRVVQVRPLAVPGVIYSRVVESGSGYLAQGDYDLLVGAPHSGTYLISVYQPGHVIEAETTQGQDVTIYADGRVLPGLH